MRTYLKTKFSLKCHIRALGEQNLANLRLRADLNVARPDQDVLCAVSVHDADRPLAGHVEVQFAGRLSALIDRTGVKAIGNRDGVDDAVSLAVERPCHEDEDFRLDSPAVGPHRVVGLVSPQRWLAR